MVRGCNRGGCSSVMVKEREDRWVGGWMMHMQARDYG